MCGRQHPFRVGLAADLGDRLVEVEVVLGACPALRRSSCLKAAEISVLHPTFPATRRTEPCNEQRSQDPAPRLQGSGAGSR